MAVMLKDCLILVGINIQEFGEVTGETKVNEHLYIGNPTMGAYLT